MEYGCPTSNRFGLPSDDSDIEDPSELVNKAAKEAAIAKNAPKKVATKTASQPVKKEEPKKSAEPASSTVSNVRGGRGRGGRGTRGGPREGGTRTPRDGNNLADRFGESNARGRGATRGGRGIGRPPRGENANSSVDEAAKDTTFDNATPFQKHGATHDRRGGRGGVRGGRGGRQYDRHSGSDRTTVRGAEKKEGHGKGNWGTISDEIVGETEPVVTTDGEAEEPAAPREKTAAELQYESELAEYNKMKTLKEFKAEQKAESSEFKTRKGGEGVKDDFGKLVPLLKGQDPTEDKEETIIVRKEPTKKVVPVNLQFAETKRGGQSGRGRGEGHSSGRGAHGQRTRGASRFDASSAEDFPALK